MFNYGESLVMMIRWWLFLFDRGVMMPSHQNQRWLNTGGKDLIARSGHIMYQPNSRDMTSHPRIQSWSVVCYGCKINVCESHARTASIFVHIGAGTVETIFHLISTLWQNNLEAKNCHFLHVNHYNWWIFRFQLSLSERTSVIMSAHVSTNLVSSGGEREDHQPPRIITIPNHHPSHHQSLLNHQSPSVTTINHHHDYTNKHHQSSSPPLITISHH